MKQVTHDELKSDLLRHYDKKISMFVYGRFGIGKSDTVIKTATDIAAKKGKVFIDWNKISDEEKMNVFNNPKDYFTLIDIRLAEYDSSDIKGLPIFKDDNKAIEFKIPFWALLMAKPESDGILFFDEINLAPPLVMSSCYKIILNRVVNDIPINPNWGVFGAGNLDEDRAYTNSMAPPLKDRASEVELVAPDGDRWTQWAIPNGVEPKVIGYINFKPQDLFKVDFNDKQKYTTPRGWERLSNLIKGVDDFKEMELYASSAISEGVAKSFVAWCKISQQIDLPGILANPEKIKSITELSVKWFINTAVAENYANGKVKFDKVMGISKALDEIDNVELVAYLWKMCNGLTKNFRKEFLKGIDDDLVKKYQKYLI